MGRPTLYTEDLGSEIGIRLSMGKSLRRICEDEEMPTWRTVLRWAGDRSHPFCQQYARAREVQADTWADEIIEVADSASNHDTAVAARVRVDARKWVASKLKPRSYGDRLHQGHDGADEEKKPAKFSAMLPSEAKLLLEKIARVEEIRALPEPMTPERAKFMLIGRT
jgi:hypothetical protein